MRTKDEILTNLVKHTNKLDGQNYELAAVAMIETEIQIDIRELTEISTELHNLVSNTSPQH